MSGVKHNEPAFPHPGGAGDFTVQKSHMGMTLRDYFAGQAAAGLAMISPAAKVAALAYELADAMLEARKS